GVGTGAHGEAGGAGRPPRRGLLRAAGGRGEGRLRPTAKDVAQLTGRRGRCGRLRSRRHSAGGTGRGAERGGVGTAGPMTAILAPAKLTLSLAVTGVRPDGYHELRSEMVSLDLSDELTLTEGGRGLTVVADA